MTSQGTLRAAASVMILLSLASCRHAPSPVAVHPVTSPTPNPTATGRISAPNLDTDCASQYTQLSAYLDDVPLELPAPVIDIVREHSEFRLYATPLSDDTRQIILDCSTDAVAGVTANLTASPHIGTTVLGTGNAYYRDYMPDGSGALVGVTADRTTAVTTSVDGDNAPKVEVNHGYFVVWPPFNNLDSVHINVTNADGRTTTLDAPTTVAGTYNGLALLDACQRTLAKQTKPAFDGDHEPVFSLTQAPAFVADIYVGNFTAACTFDGSQHVAGLNFYTYHHPAGNPPYGMRKFIGGTYGGLLIGYVPKDVTDVWIFSGGQTISDLDAAHGLFAAWIPASIFTDKKTRVVARSPMRTYTYTGSGLRKPD